MLSKAKKVALMLLIFLLIFAAGSTRDNKNQVKNQVLENINQYNIDVEFNPDEKTIRGNQSVTYINNEDIKIDKIYFHLYPNAFRKKETVPFLLDDYISAYPNGFKEGYIDIKELNINGEKTEYTIKEPDSTIMEIALPYELDIGEKISIDMEYIIKIPGATDRFGYGNDTYNLGNWYPIIAVYDDSGWNLDPYYPIGDPFYSDISNYKVTIKAPKDYIIACTGNILSTEANDNVLEWKIQADSFRDFAWAASNKFEIQEKKINDTIIKMYFIDDGILGKYTKEKALEFTEKSIEIFNEIFGEYPYKEYSVVQTDFPSGMEYPGIVFIGSQYYDKAFTDYLEVMIAHETAHQWWYGVVGNDQIDEAWLDESFATYSEAIYFSENYGQKTGEKYYEHENEEAFLEKKDSLDDDAILKGLNDFNNWNDYSLLVYTKGAMFLNDIQEKYGKEVFYNILRTYYDRYKFKIATTQDFLNICEEVTEDELDDYFKKWLECK